MMTLDFMLSVSFKNAKSRTTTKSIFLKLSSSNESSYFIINMIFTIFLKEQKLSGCLQVATMQRKAEDCKNKRGTEKE